MDFWTAVVSIAAIAIPFEFVKFAIRQKHKSKEMTPAVPDSKVKDLEQRIQSLETLIIDLEREKKFRDL